MMSSLRYWPGAAGKKLMTDRQILSALRDHDLLERGACRLPADFPPYDEQVDEDLVPQLTGSTSFADGPHVGKVWKVKTVIEYMESKMRPQREARIAEIEKAEARIGLKHML